MTYFNEFKEILKDSSKSSYSIYVRSKTFLVEGFYEIISYSQTELILKIKDKKLSFLGREFAIIKSSKGEIVLSGVVDNFCIDNV